ncbi:neuropeptide CCHamide-1 receptor isoform X2 [Cryptotermes secundus]|nr:neuropeptide CCHamide-1 receptor isoform X2 [Cryptotermes secundus]XP_033609154.1 neuropeptide CCHamide-1 receptor isoform X2 [Cryptotermes secundus]XP_033609155.1 neuropeptide CCHamide-1 receptor isoform X2 [Cryptotermes secundus]
MFGTSDPSCMLEKCDPIMNSSYLLDYNCSCWNSSALDLDEVELPENEVGYIPYNKRPETYIVPILFVLIFVVGVLGNGTLVLIFLRHRNMRNTPNTYIFSLALGDLLVIVICVPFISTLYTLESWPYGELICKVSEFAKDVSIGVSVFTLTALSAERYCAIVNPMRRHVAGRLSAKPVTLFTALVIWILAILLAMPAAIFSFVREIQLEGNKTIKVCHPYPEKLGRKYVQIMVVIKFLSYYAIPLIIITFFYILMAHHLVLSTRNMPGEMQGQSTQIRARKKVAKMVLAFVIIFMLCFLPYHIFNLWFHFDPQSEEVYDDFWHAFRIIGFCLSFINSCINPITLYCVSGTFRKHFNRHLFCCCTDSRGRHSLSRRGNSAILCETSSHTLIHLNSTVRRHCLQPDDVNCSVATTHTTVFNLDKT